MIILIYSFLSQITLSPSYAASGQTLFTHLRVPQRYEGMWTTRLSLELSPNVSITPEVPIGWSVNMSCYNFSADRNMTDNARAAPDKITWTAANSTPNSLQNGEFLFIGLELTLPCSYSDPVRDGGYTGTNSIWKHQHTLWFKVEQEFTSGNDSLVFKWIVAETDTSNVYEQGASPGVGRSPYLFIHAGDTCENLKTGVVGGMQWMGGFIPPLEHVIMDNTLKATDDHLHELHELHAELEDELYELHDELHEFEHEFERELEHLEEHFKEQAEREGIHIGLSVAALAFPAATIASWIAWSCLVAKSAQRAQKATTNPVEDATVIP